ncbi:hypothetical protein O181_024459 [Austropuccinia psidii MF-1]|uniref:Uncharacterized protein n=1 Tax=Austropuccinia psidii MF-1 TaxID=1389203 RepID=A0A9Q3CIP6_9BASI|nr:hypothetical protein [Austropuccinia psidii MF-1]
MHPQCPPDVTPTLPSPLPPNMLMLPRHPQDMPLILPLPLLMPYPTHFLPFLCLRSSLNHAQSSLPLTILMLVNLKIRLQCHPHLCPHHSLCFRTPAAYNPYAPVAPSRYVSNAALNPP